MPIRSMTGFARVSRSTPSGELTLSIKTVNHRGLDMHFHMPLEFDAVEPALRAAVRKRVVARTRPGAGILQAHGGAAGAASVINEASAARLAGILSRRWPSASASIRSPI